jgi:hypothetical protein
MQRDVSSVAVLFANHSGIARDSLYHLRQFDFTESFLSNHLSLPAPELSLSLSLQNSLSLSLHLSLSLYCKAVLGVQ